MMRLTPLTTTHNHTRPVPSLLQQQQQQDRQKMVGRARVFYGAEEEDVPTAPRSSTSHLSVQPADDTLAPPPPSSSQLSSLIALDHRKGTWGVEQSQAQTQSASLAAVKNENRILMAELQ